MTRLSYLPLYFFLCITVLSFYAVFIVLLIQKSQLTKANMLLQQQQHWHQLAYMDELTQLANRAAYTARTAELEGRPDQASPCALLIFDVDDFKHVNDTFGHHVGNAVLRKTAEFFLSFFPAEHYEIFRVGGDEFAAIALNVSMEEVQKLVNKLNNSVVCADPRSTCSCGASAVNFREEGAFEKAFIRADQAMYTVKSGKKAARPTA